MKIKNSDWITLTKFCKINKLKKPKLVFSDEKRWSYMGFFKIGSKFFTANCYGNPIYVDNVSTKNVPSDVKLKFSKLG